MKNQTIYDQINDTRRDYPNTGLHEVIREQAAKSPNAIAVLDNHSEQTYAELDEKSDQLAGYLASLGIGPGDLVGVCCNRDVDTPAILVGIMKSGAGYVPLDPDYPVDRLAYMVNDAQLKHVLAHSNQIELTSTFATPTTIVDRDWKRVVELADGVKHPIVEIQPQSDVAYVIYTSGSTGNPKGVLVPHSAIVNLLHGMLDWPGFTSEDRILATTTLSFDISLAEMFLPLIVGGSVAVVDRATAKDTSALVSAIRKFKVNFMQATPAMWRMILDTEFECDPKTTLVTAGEPLSAELAERLCAKSEHVWNLYGPTEATVYSSGWKVTNETKVVIGRPVANTQVYIVDENNQLCEPEKPGELLIAGDGVTLGYLNQPERTAKSFTTWNEIPVYRTGDLARLTNDGQIDHLGRIDNQIKLHGHRIELGEIDTAMAKQTGVRQAATVLREDRPGDQRLVGYLLLEKDACPDTTKIRESIATTLPDYMVPSTIVVVEAFPYTPSGKLDRKSFPPPSTARPEIGVEYLEPKSDTAKTIAGIWQDVLQLDQVGIQDNFFDLGGNSIRAVRALAQIKTELEIDISGAEFFDNPTIQALLGLAEKKQVLLHQLQNQTHHPERKSGQYAIVGMAARMPGAETVEEFWDNLVNERESIRFFSKEELDSTLDPRDTNAPNYVAARGIIEGADQFDARFFKTTPRAAELTCPQQRIMLELCWTALEDAGIIPCKSDSTIGVWAGTYATNYLTKNLLTNPELIRQTGEFQVGVLNEKDYIATRVAHALNLTGPAINVNTACSTSLVALIEACKSLDSGHCDVAIAGGASVTFPQNSGHLHQTGSIFTPDGHCRPFDAQGEGTLFSDGAGVVVVKRLEEAISAGDRIYAVVKGFGINNDGGEKASFSAPSIDGQARAVAMAQSMANVAPETISYIEAHGTATPIGDPIEVSALRTVFESQTKKKQFCAIGSVKSNIGHTVAAAGVAGLIKTALSLYHEQIPATLHFQNPNPQIDFEQSPFYVCDQLTDWTRSARPRRAGVSSFGVGGTNAHILLEESPLNPKASPDGEGPHPTNELPVAILPVSGKTEQALLDNVEQLASQLATSQASLAEVAQTLQQGRDEFTYRAAIVSDNLHDAMVTFQEKKPPRFLKRKSTAASREIVFMFPGQGSQYVRMGQNLYDDSSIFREHMDRCAEILQPLLGRDLRHVLFPPVGDEQTAEEILKNTQFTQPALFALGYSLAQVWLSWGFQPTGLMGHSIGEFAAACTAGVFSLEDGLRIIAERGRAMQALPGGSMMSVRMPGSEVEPMLWGEMAIGSFNGPSLCVVSGPDAQVAQLQRELEAKDIVCRHLHTSHAFHSPMMNEIVEPFAKFVSQFELRKPNLPILSTVTGQWMTEQQATDPMYWAQHLQKAVRFSDAVSTMWDSERGDPSRILIELGPRRTLATLSKQHATDPKNQIAIPTLGNSADENTEWLTMMSAVAQLWLAGVDVDWQRLSIDGHPRKKATHVSLPTYAFQRKRYFVEPGQNESPKTATSSMELHPPHSAPSVEPTNKTLNTASPATVQEKIPMSRIPNIIAAIQDVFENTSGFDLDEFEGDTTFFEMGLDSLVLTQTATALKKEMEFEVTFRQLLEETPTVDSLAAWLDAKLPPEKYQATPDSEQVAPAVVEQIDPSPQPASSASPEPPAFPTQAPPTFTASTFATPVRNGDVNQSIIQSQLQLMAAQLQLLSGQPVQYPEQPTQPKAANLLPETAASIQTEEPPLDADAELGSSKPSRNETSPEDQTQDPPAKKAKRFATVKLNDGTLDADQQAALDEFIRMNNLMMPKSKSYAQEHRRYMADPRTVSGFRPNMKEMTHPIVVERSKGVQLWDIDGNEYVDFTCGFGSNILGHTHEITVKAITEQVQKDYAIGPQSPLAGEVAKLFCDITGNERMAFSNTGSEAVLGCTRLARNATGRDLIVMFNGDYHGILDEVIARGNKKLKSFPAATGIPKDHVGNTLILDYGTDESLAIIRERLDEIAAVLVEPVQSRTPELQPKSFLQELRRMTENNPACLIFDEVISGLRIGLGGAQEYFGVKADLASYGKIVGGGMPIGIVAGKAEYMDGLDGGYWQYGDDSRPEAGMTYFAGTFVRHPLTLAASKAILEHLRDGGQAMYERLNHLADYLAKELNQVFQKLNAPLFLANFGSLFKIQFEQELIYSEVFFAGLRRRGMHIWDHRPCLLTLAHNSEHVDTLVSAVHDTVIECQRFGFMPGDGFEKFKPSLEESKPPQLGAKMGTDENGKPGWFIPDTFNPGQFIQIGLPID